MNLESLEEYCRNIGVDIQVVPEGTKMKPPTDKTFNLGLNPDLEKEMELLEKLFQITNSEIDDSSSSISSNSNSGSSSIGDDSSTGAWE